VAFQNFRRNRVVHERAYGAGKLCLSVADICRRHHVQGNTLLKSSGREWRPQRSIDVNRQPPVYYGCCRSGRFQRQEFLPSIVYRWIAEATACTPH
jgi:hypothetical protein